MIGYAHHNQWVYCNSLFHIISRLTKYLYFELELGFWIIDSELGTTALISEVNSGLLALIRSLNIRIPVVLEKTPQFSDQTDKPLIHKPLSD